MRVAVVAFLALLLYVGARSAGATLGVPAWLFILGFIATGAVLQFLYSRLVNSFFDAVGVSDLQRAQFRNDSGVVPAWVTTVGFAARSLLSAGIVMPLFHVGAACGLFFDSATPVTYGFINGEVMGWANHKAYMIDLASVDRPGEGKVLFVAGVGPDHETRDEWLIEANCGLTSFVRGVGTTRFQAWPPELMARPSPWRALHRMLRRASNIP